jgi:hypothetical protein
MRIFLEEQQFVREHFTHLHKPVHRITIMQYLTRSAISNCLDSNFIDISRQKRTQTTTTTTTATTTTTTTTTTSTAYSINNTFTTSDLLILLRDLYFVILNGAV